MFTVRTRFQAHNKKRKVRETNTEKIVIVIYNT